MSLNSILWDIQPLKTKAASGVAEPSRRDSAALARGSQRSCPIASCILNSVSPFCCSRRQNCTAKPVICISCFKIVSRNLCCQKNCFPETIITTPLLETVKAETGLVVSFLASKRSSRESQMSLRVKADFTLRSWRRPARASGFR